MTSHTPGPWERSNPDEVHGWVRFHSPITSKVIVECGPHNADLVGAAPEILEALKDATRRLEDWIGAECECDNTHKANGTVCCLCDYRAAIAKAEGR